MMSSAPSAEAPKPGPVRTRRYKAAMACTTCRRRKLKCDGVRPACSRCSKDAGRRGPCTYVLTSEMANGESNAQPRRRSPATASSPHLPTPTSAHGAAGTSEAYNDNNTGPFVSKVAAAIDARLGLTAEQRQSLHIPMLDAPLFGKIDPPQPSNERSIDALKVLPPRRHADMLLNLYWGYCEVLEPCLDQRRFYHAYNASYTGGESDYDERIFLSTINIVFALGSQLQENVPAEERETASAAFFQRAWSLLRPETAMWEPGSLELVQCLLLMSRFMQCAGNLKVMWMVGGTAIHVAIALGLHNFEKPCSDGDAGARLRREVWTGCVYMEKNLSWLLGRPITVNVYTQAPASQEQGAAAYMSQKIMELDDLHGQILLYQSLSITGFAEYLNQSTVSTKPDIHTALRFDERLTKLSTAFDSHQVDINDPASRRSILFRLRVHHTRLLIFRPMCTRFCLSQTQATNQTSAADKSMENRIYQDCAIVCLESSQKIIELIAQDQRVNGGAGILPWWHRSFWLCIASQHVVASMMKPDVFGDMAPGIWATAITALQAEEYLSPVIKRQTSTWKRIWQKVTELHNPGQDQVAPMEAATDPDFQNVFQYLGLGACDGLLGLENESWLDGVENFQWSI